VTIIEKLIYRIEPKLTNFTHPKSFQCIFFLYLCDFFCYKHQVSSFKQINVVDLTTTGFHHHQQQLKSFLIKCTLLFFPGCTHYLLEDAADAFTL
jgi:hypothetical protein